MQHILWHISERLSPLGLQVPFQATVLGISPAYPALASSPVLSPVPANFTPPTLPGLNVTYYGKVQPKISAGENDLARNGWNFTL